MFDRKHLYDKTPNSLSYDKNSRIIFNILKFGTRWLAVKRRCVRNDAVDVDLASSSTICSGTAHRLVTIGASIVSQVVDCSPRDLHRLDDLLLEVGADATYAVLELCVQLKQTGIQRLNKYLAAMITALKVSLLTNTVVTIDSFIIGLLIKKMKSKRNKLH